jgi:hypothetical protein
MNDEQIGKRTVLMGLLADYFEKNDVRLVHVFVPEWMWPYGAAVVENIDGEIRATCFRCAYHVPMFYSRDEDA